MKQKHLKALRIALSVLFFLAIGLLFVDFRELIPPAWSDRILFLQFTPSVVHFLTVPVLAASGFLAVTLLTLLFGRVYCSTICPLGVLQDIAGWMAKKTHLIRRYKFKKAQRVLRYSFLSAALLVLLGGSLFAINLLDPYSIFGRIFSDLVRPGIVVVNNWLAVLLVKVDVFWLYRYDMTLFTWKTAAFPAITLGVVLWLSLFHGRLYCNSVCPVGTLLGLLSKISLFRIRFDKVSCTRCGKCSSACKSSCIDFRNMQVDFSRCVSCFNCMQSCTSDSISYKPVWKKTQAVDETDTNKRAFIAKTLAYGATLAGFSGIPAATGANPVSPGLIPNKINYPVCPPGSMSLKHFSDRCTACHLCVTACPTKVLQPAFLEYGFTGMMQPRMDFNTEYCNYDCTICSEVCPTGAILPLTTDDKHSTQIGKVHFVIEKCVVYTDGTACGSCSEHCPTQAVRMVPYSDNLTIPETTEAICVGCGACEYACPVKPYKAIYVDGNPVHLVAEAPTIEELEHNASEEFPF